MKRILALTLAAAAGLAACDKSPTGPRGRVPSVGEEVQLNVNFDDNCANAVFRPGTVMAVSDRAVVVADQTNPSGGFSDQDFRDFAEAFDDVVWPTMVASFGEPTDIDENGRVVVFFTRAINQLTPPSSTFYVNGLFFSRDLFPKKATAELGACGSSNFSELLYMLVPDPSRGGVFGYESVKRNTVGVMAHETQHLVSASRRLYTVKAGEAWNEAVWLNEGLSHVAEELVFYQQSGLGPRRNLAGPSFPAGSAANTAFFAYMAPNVTRYYEWVRSPEQNSVFETDDDLATRGAAWNFLRYAADRRAGDDAALWKSLVDSRQVGMANLRAALGTDPVPLLRDWAVSVYADDAVAGVDARFTQPSWNWRGLLQGGLPLTVRQLAGGSASFSLDPGAASYLRFGVGAGRAELRVTSGGVAPSGACAAVPALAVGQVHTLAPAAGQALCVDGAGDYTLVAFYGAESEGDALPVSVAATGVQAVIPPPSPSRAPLAARELGAEVYHEDAGVRQRLHERQRELDALVRGGGARFSSAAAAAPDPTKLYLSVMRTR
ncbi:MAG TPA: hypothetical protein VHG91_10420 [Longimicrobium sp.]|nr:hypothetical protein [Longimicrobium sp.]